MNNSTNPLIDALLDDEENFRQALLRQTLTAVRRRNTMRKVRRLSCVAGLAGLLSFLLWSHLTTEPVKTALSQPPKTPPAIAATPEPNAMIVHTVAGITPGVTTVSDLAHTVRTSPAGDMVQILDAAKLHSVLESQGVVWIQGVNGQQGKIFVTSN